MNLELSGKRAVVTGASAGIGRAIARQLVQEGVSCALGSRSLERARATVSSLAPDRWPGARLVPVQMELKDPSSITAMAELVEAELGGVEILVNAASEVSGNVAEDFWSVTDQFVLSSFEDKFLGTLRCCRALVPFMRSGGYGRIINVAGHTAREAGSISAGARNSAVVNLTKALSRALGPDGITVNAIHPFTTITERLESRMQAVAERSGRSLTEQLQTVSARTALGRLITAEEIAWFVAFLASPRSVALSGEVVALTGGVGTAVFS